MHITLIGVPLPKIDQKPIENRSEIDPKTVPNRSQIGPKSVQDRLRNRPRCQHRFWTVLEPFSDRFGAALAGFLAASGGSRGRVTKMRRYHSQEKGQRPPLKLSLKMATTLAFWSPEGHLLRKNTIVLCTRRSEGPAGTPGHKKGRQS